MPAARPWRLDGGCEFMQLLDGLTGLVQTYGLKISE
jgi:glycine betaine/choline ABC-type transport system substrate-binding protein